MNSMEINAFPAIDQEQELNELRETNKQTQRGLRKVNMELERCQKEHADALADAQRTAEN